MTAREKIEQLTAAWCGLALFSGLISLVQNGLGVFSVLIALLSTAVSIGLALFFGRRLLARSSAWRFVLMVLSAISALFGILAVLKLGWAFLFAWRLSLLLTAVVVLCSTWMCAKSWRVLSDRQVKAYFG
jgi:hypothetical protein